MKLFHRETGEGKSIIILHGVFGTSDNWLSISKDLSSDHKLYLLDLRNHGQSPHDDEFNYEVMSEDLREFIIDHNIINPILIGHSMGGKVVMKFLTKYPEMIEKAFVVDISPRFYKRHHDDILNGLNSIDINNLASRQEADVQLSQFEPNPAVRQFLLKNLYRKENGFAWRVNLPVITNSIDNVGEALDENASVDKPVIFIRGEKSWYIKEEDENLIRKIFKNVEIETVENAGHWVQAENPNGFIKAVRKYI